MIFAEKKLSPVLRAGRYYRFIRFNEGEYYNFDTTEGELRAAHTLRIEANAPYRVALQRIYAGGGGVFVYASDQKLYRYAERRLQPLEGAVFANAPAFCVATEKTENGCVQAFLFSDGKKTYAAESDTLRLTKAVGFRAACYAFERLWTVNGDYTLRFGAPLRLDEFAVERNGGGEIRLPDAQGKILALIPFENRICIVREYGIQRFDVRGDQTDFTVEDCDCTGEKILADTIACGNDGVWYCTDFAAYRLRGLSVERVQDSVFGKYALRARCGVCAEGKYIVLAEGAFGGERGVASFGFGARSVEIVRADLIGAAADGGRCVYLCADGIYRREEGGAPRFAQWIAEPNGLGRGSLPKAVRRVRALGRGVVWLRVASEYGERLLPLRFADGRADCAVGLKGEYFTVSVQTDCVDALVREICLEYTLERGNRI